MRAGVFGYSPLSEAIFLSVLAIAPLLFIPSLKRLSVLSSMGFLSTVLVTLAVGAAAVVDPHRRAIPQQVETCQTAPSAPEHPELEDAPAHEAQAQRSGHGAREF